MALVDAQLRLVHPCPYQEVANEAPGSTILRWPDHGRSVLLLANRTPQGFKRLVGLAREVFRATYLAREERQAVALVPDPGWTDPGSIEGLAERSGVWVIPPVLLVDGRESCRVVARSREELGAFTTGLRRIGPVELLSVASQDGVEALTNPLATSVHLVKGLTDAQVHSVLAAWDAGLFEVPSRTRWGTVSASLGISRSTFGEHLRKGQRHLMRNSVTALRLRASRTREPIMLPRIRRQSFPGKTLLRGVRQGTN